MIEFTVLGSGSTGNSVLIATGKTRVLIDAGMSAKQILTRLAAVGVDPEDIDGILITHEHGDHVGGLRVLLRTVDCPVFISGETRDAYLRNRRSGDTEALRRAEAIDSRTVEITSDAEFRIGDIDFNPFSVPHDAADNFGFTARHAGVKVATLMDFGHFTPLITENLRGCDAIVVESNHSLDMLMTCPVYNWDLKRRISSETGHLSNEDLAFWLTSGFDGSAREIVLAHLSQRANEPNLARLTAESALGMRSPLFRAETAVSVSDHRYPTDWIRF